MTLDLCFFLRRDLALARKSSYTVPKGTCHMPWMLLVYAPRGGLLKTVFDRFLMKPEVGFIATRANPYSTGTVFGSQKRASKYDLIVGLIFWRVRDR